MLAVLAAVVLPIHVAGDVDCPSPTQVERELSTLLAETEVVQRDEATLERRRRKLWLRLNASSGELLAERELPDGDCAGLAREAAVLLAAWATDRHPEWARRSAPAPLAAQRPPRRAPAKTPNRAPRRVVPASGGDRWQLDGSASLTADLGGGVAPNGGVTVALFAPLGAGVLLGAMVPSARREPFDLGELRWSRVALTAAPSYRVRLGERWLLDGSVGLWLAFLTLDGRFPGGRSDTGWEPGLTALTRLRWGGALATFAELGVGTLVRTPTARTGDGASLPLAAQTIWLGAGVSFCTGRPL